MLEKLYTIEETAEHMRISKKSAYNRRGEGHPFWFGKAVKIGAKVLYKESDINDYINNK